MQCFEFTLGTTMLYVLLRYLVKKSNILGHARYEQSWAVITSQQHEQRANRTFKAKHDLNLFSIAPDFIHPVINWSIFFHCCPL